MWLRTNSSLSHVTGHIVDANVQVHGFKMNVSRENAAHALSPIPTTWLDSVSSNSHSCFKAKGSTHTISFVDTSRNKWSSGIIAYEGPRPK